MVQSLANFLVDLIDCTRNDAAIFVVWSRSIHGKSFTCTRLPITHDSSIVAVGNLLNCFEGTVIKYILLRGIVHDLVEFELPVFGNVVYETSALVFWNVHSHMLQDKLIRLAWENSNQIKLIKPSIYLFFKFIIYLQN